MLLITYVKYNVNTETKNARKELSLGAFFAFESPLKERSQ
jgi:hypothetical protein